MITSNITWSLAWCEPDSNHGCEPVLNVDQGAASNLDQLLTAQVLDPTRSTAIPARSRFDADIGMLSSKKLSELRAALRGALSVD